MSVAAFIVVQISQFLFPYMKLSIGDSVPQYSEAKTQDKGLCILSLNDIKPHIAVVCVRGSVRVYL